MLAVLEPTLSVSISVSWGLPVCLSLTVSLSLPVCPSLSHHQSHQHSTSCTPVTSSRKVSSEFLTIPHLVPVCSFTRFTSHSMKNSFLSPLALAVDLAKDCDSSCWSVGAAELESCVNTLKFQCASAKSHMRAVMVAVRGVWRAARSTMARDRSAVVPFAHVIVSVCEGAAVCPPTIFVVDVSCLVWLSVLINGKTKLCILSGVV